MSLIGAYLDLVKAFATINHNILLRRLEHYDFRSPALRWFQRYLSNRTQMVRFKNVISE